MKEMVIQEVYNINKTLNYKHIVLFLRDFPSIVFQRYYFWGVVKTIIRDLFFNQYII